MIYRIHIFQLIRQKHQLTTSKKESYDSTLVYTDFLEKCTLRLNLMNIKEISDVKLTSFAKMQPLKKTQWLEIWVVSHVFFKWPRFHCSENKEVFKIAVKTWKLTES